MGIHDEIEADRRRDQEAADKRQREMGKGW